jgi:hypothetical protein
MDVISRSEAISQGLDRYFTGKPCKRGNCAPRRTSNYQCTCDGCREADNESTAAYVAANKDRVKEYKERWAKENADAHKAQRAAHYQANRDRIKAKSKAYREANPDQAKEAQRASYVKSRNTYLAKSRDRHAANRKKLESAPCITQQELLSLLSYDPSSGNFRWAKTASSRAQEGSLAGTVMPTKAGGYVVISLTSAGVQRRILAHRLAFLYMDGALPDFPDVVVDHIDGNGLNNAWANLRLVDHRGNSCNQKLRSTNSSGVNGVSWDKSMQKFEVYVWDHGTKRHIAYTDDLEEAAALREQAEGDLGYHPNHGSKR